MKKLTALFLSCMMILSMTSCKNEEAKETEISEEVSASEETADENEQIRIAALKGPTGMGLASLVTSEEGKASYAVTLLASPQEAAPLVMQGKADMISLPSNLGAVLKDKLSVIAINTVGNLTFVTKNVKLNDISDLKGKTVLSSGKGASPEAMLNFILENNGIDPLNDVTIEYKAEHAECLAALLQAEEGIALLPQPFATVALTKDESLKEALDFNELWKKASGGVPPVTGIMAVTKDFLANNKDAVDSFLLSYKESMELAKIADDKAVEAIASLEIAPAPIAKKALPKCGIEFITGEEMKNTLNSYYEVLNNFNPKLIGEKLPEDDFYYLG